MTTQEQTRWNRNIARALDVDGESKVRYLGNDRFEVESATSDDVHTVTRDGDHTRCTCKAGQVGRRCWHQATVLMVAGYLSPAPAPVVDDMTALAVSLLRGPR